MAKKGYQELISLSYPSARRTDSSQSLFLPGSREPSSTFSWLAVTSRSKSVCTLTEPISVPHCLMWRQLVTNVGARGVGKPQTNQWQVLLWPLCL